MTWSLHPKLSELTTEVGDLPLSRVLLENDSNYPWLILVPRMEGISEIIDLDPASRALKAVATFEKLNVAALGNMVKQLHVHVIGRSATDATWPKPVWGLVPPVPYKPEARNVLVNKLRHELKM
jgi:diadenosine tetraphosphate (Ap4A) HIT family hydrolase